MIELQALTTPVSFSSPTLSGAIQEPMLTYNKALNRWEWADEQMSIWIDDATFRLYINVYLEGLRIVQPTLKQVIKATKHCMRLAYWHGREKNFDRRIHIVRH